PSHLPPDRAAARGPPAHPGRGDRADRAALRREEPPRPGALLLPGEPDHSPLPPPRAPVRERAQDAGHLLEHHRARLPGRRLSDPARDAAGGGGPTAVPPRRPPARHPRPRPPPAPRARRATARRGRARDGRGERGATALPAHARPRAVPREAGRLLLAGRTRIRRSRRR